MSLLTFPRGVDCPDATVSAKVVAVHSTRTTEFPPFVHVFTAEATAMPPPDDQAGTTAVVGQPVLFNFYGTWALAAASLINAGDEVHLRGVCVRDLPAPTGAVDQLFSGGVFVVPAAGDDTTLTVAQRQEKIAVPGSSAASGDVDDDFDVMELEVTPRNFEDPVARMRPKQYQAQQRSRGRTFADGSGQVLAEK